MEASTHFTSAYRYLSYIDLLSRLSDVYGLLPHRSRGDFTLGANGTDNLPGLRTYVNSGQGRARGHGLI